MKVNITVNQEITNGIVGPKKYSLHVSIPYTYREEDAYLHDLDEGTVKELIARLTQELQRALEVI